MEIAIIFIELKYILPKKISKKSDFTNQNLVVAPNEDKVAYIIILHIYESNTQIRQKSYLSLYHKVNLTIFWFVNIMNC